MKNYFCSSLVNHSGLNIDRLTYGKIVNSLFTWSQYLVSIITQNSQLPAEAYMCFCQLFIHQSKEETRLSGVCVTKLKHFALQWPSDKLDWIEWNSAARIKGLIKTFFVYKTSWAHVKIMSSDGINIRVCTADDGESKELEIQSDISSNLESPLERRPSFCLNEEQRMSKSFQERKSDVDGAIEWIVKEIVSTTESKQVQLILCCSRSSCKI